jgi:hypothetical protein
MQPDKQPKATEGKEPENVPLSETISNAHSAGDGAIRLSEDGLVEPSGETNADAEAHKEPQPKREEY